MEMSLFWFHDYYYFIFFWWLILYWYCLRPFKLFLECISSAPKGVSCSTVAAGYHFIFLFASILRCLHVRCLLVMIMTLAQTWKKLSQKLFDVIYIFSYCTRRLSGLFRFCWGEMLICQAFQHADFLFQKEVYRPSGERFSSLLGSIMWTSSVLA